MQPHSPKDSEPKLSQFNSINNKDFSVPGENIVKAIEGKQIIDGNDQVHP